MGIVLDMGQERSDMCGSFNGLGLMLVDYCLGCVCGGLQTSLACEMLLSLAKVTLDGETIHWLQLSSWW